MSRDLSNDVQTALAAKELQPMAFIEGLFDDGALRLWTGVGDLTWNGYTWTGAGHVLGFKPPAENIEVKASGGEISLNGLDSSVLALALDEPYQGRRCTIWFGLRAADGTVTADPDIVFRGVFDVFESEDAGETCTLRVTIESRLLARAKVRRYTPEDQKLDYPDDLAFDYVAAIQDKEVVWKLPVR